MDVDKGKVAYRECLVWALEVLTCAHARGELAPVQLVEMQAKVLGLQDHLTSLYHWQWQVMPFIYMHLISATTGAYMLLCAPAPDLGAAPPAHAHAHTCTHMHMHTHARAYTCIHVHTRVHLHARVQCRYAVDKGLLFTPTASYTYGVIMPACQLVMRTACIAPHLHAHLRRGHARWAGCLGTPLPPVAPHAPPLANSEAAPAPPHCHPHRHYRGHATPRAARRLPMGTALEPMRRRDPTRHTCRRVLRC